MIVRSIRERFRRKPPCVHDAPECRMHVHVERTLPGGEIDLQDVARNRPTSGMHQDIDCSKSASGFGCAAARVLR